MSSSEDEFDVDSTKFDKTDIPDLDNLLIGQSMSILFNGQYYGARVKRITKSVSPRSVTRMLPSFTPWLSFILPGRACMSSIWINHWSKFQSGYHSAPARCASYTRPVSAVSCLLASSIGVDQTNPSKEINIARIPGKLQR